MSLKNFLETKRSKKDLEIVLEVIQDFKSYESEEEWALHSFESWQKLEQLEGYLEKLLQKNLKED